VGAVSAFSWASSGRLHALEVFVMKIPKTYDEIMEHFGGLIDEVTAELLESYAKGETVRVSEALAKSGRVAVEGVVLRVFPVRHFSKNGRSGKVGSVVIQDDCTVRVNFWNEAAEIIEAGDIVEGARIKVRGYARGEEIHVNSLSEVEVFVDFVNISELDEKVGERVNVKGFVSGLGEPEKANEIYISDETGRVKVLLENESLYYAVDIGSYVEIYNALAGEDGIYVDRNSRFSVGE
jgi:replication factor A1